jgi:hypothetical protein
MKRAIVILGFVAPLLMSLVLGCARAYHSYSGCHFDCTYCPPPPLPYLHYEGCVCHACAVQRHLPASTSADRSGMR